MYNVISDIAKVLFFHNSNILKEGNGKPLLHLVCLQILLCVNI